MDSEQLRDFIADTTASGVIMVAAYQSIMAIPMPDSFNAITGAAVAYLFIKHSPNTL